MSTLEQNGFDFINKNCYKCDLNMKIRKDQFFNPNINIVCKPCYNKIIQTEYDPENPIFDMDSFKKNMKTSQIKK